MHAIYDPSERGFPESLRAVDRAQVSPLREISAASASRLVLKGGMAMRTSVGSMRLTKYIDFDRSLSLSRQSLKGLLNSGLKNAAASSGLRGVQIEFTKDTDTTLRARLAGNLASGAPVRFEVEVSGRSEPDKEFILEQTLTSSPA